MSLELPVAGAMLVSLTFYVLLGGADYGGGVWDLFARGPRADDQRALIAHALGPIWEANHVWLILVVVILFTAFPPAFAAIATALHIPLTLLLIGIVLRGSAFTFRTYDSQRDSVQKRWSRVFSIASMITPVFLGTIVGSIASGTIIVEQGVVLSGFVHTWLAPFPFAVGFFALALFAFLAAVYLTLETENRELQDDFRRRALISGVAVGGAALVVFLLAGVYAPTIRAGIGASLWAVPLHLATAICAAGAFAAFLETEIPSGAIVGRGAGNPDPVGLGARTVPLHRRAKHHNPIRCCTIRDAALAVVGAWRRWARALSVFLLPVPGV